MSASFETPMWAKIAAGVSIAAIAAVGLMAAVPARQNPSRRRRRARKNPWDDIPDEDAAFQREFAQRKQRAREYADKYKLQVSDEDLLAGVEDGAREYVQGSASAMGRAVAAVRNAMFVLQKWLPEATLSVAGSLASGKFFGKGPRSEFDVDLFVQNLEGLPPSAGKLTIALPKRISAAFSKAQRAIDVPLDLFVEHEGKVWAVQGSKLSRQPGRFGKEEFVSTGGRRITGRALSWDDFEQQFRADVARGK